MKNDFKDYLNEQKLDNKYSSTIKSPSILQERWFSTSDKEINGYAVNLDFTAEGVIEGIADLIDKLDDSAIKNVASKTGVKLSGTETKDQLKGIIKGAIATQNK